MVACMPLSCPPNCQKVKINEHDPGTYRRCVIEHFDTLHNTNIFEVTMLLEMTTLAALNSIILHIFM